MQRKGMSPVCAWVCCSVRASCVRVRERVSCVHAHVRVCMRLVTVMVVGWMIWPV